jgi:hypothetical protein
VKTACRAEVQPRRHHPPDVAQPAGLGVLVSGFMVFESVFRHRFQTLIVQATLVLTVLATLILIYAFFWEIVILSVVGIGLLVIVDNLRELRGSRRR